MKAKMLDDKFILGRLAILGQATVFYAKPNSGKTLLTLWLIIDAIRRGELKGSDVFYINADDTFKGLQQKLELAEQYGFYMLAPSHNGFKAGMLARVIHEQIKANEAKGKVLILDTLKKFTDLMAKDKSSNFAEMARQFVSHGGSIIMLAHTNKHRGDDGKQVFAGTADIVDDSDCAYIIDEVSQKNGIKVVEFENFKNRGDVEMKASYQYNCMTSATYKEKLESVTPLDTDEVERAKEYRDKQNQYEKDKPVIYDIIKIMEQNPDMLKTDLVKAVNEDAGHTKERIRKVLNSYDGDEPGLNHKWRSVKGENNAHTYHLHWWSKVPDKATEQ